MKVINVVLFHEYMDIITGIIIIISFDQDDCV